MPTSLAMRGTWSGANGHHGAGPWCGRAVVCSLPKAGTYFVAELLSLLGCEPTRLHLWTGGFSDYRQASLRDAREDYHKFTVTLPLRESLSLVAPGQFAVGHLECTPYTRQCLSGFKVIFVQRDLRDALVSHMRFFGATGRGGRATQIWKDLPEGPEKLLCYLDHAGAGFFGLSHPMAGWVESPGVFRLAFETLYGDEGEAARNELLRGLHAFLELPGEVENPHRLATELLGRPTLTWSGRRTNRAVYWNATVEERFGNLGGAELNARLGYR